MKELTLIKKLIIEGNTLEAIEKLRAINTNFPSDFQKIINSLSNRCNKLNSDNNKGIISSENYNIKYNRIVNSLLEIIEKVEKSSIEDYSSFDESKYKIPNDENTRTLMRDILNDWDKEIKSIDNKLINSFNPKKRKKFLNFYNKNYHRKKLGHPNKKLSKQIVAYLDYFHHLKMEDNELENFIKKNGHNLEMDAELIKLYLDAHWADHYSDLNKRTENQKWAGTTLIILRRAVEWVKNQ